MRKRQKGKDEKALVAATRTCTHGSGGRWTRQEDEGERTEMGKAVPGRGLMTDFTVAN